LDVSQDEGNVYSNKNEITDQLEKHMDAFMVHIRGTYSCLICTSKASHNVRSETIDTSRIHSIEDLASKAKGFGERAATGSLSN
jgi:hypothetical protein